MRVRVGKINYAGARAVAQEAGIATARDVGSHLREYARDTHRNAPRGGTSINRFAERRSKRGEQPAMEWGVLWATIDQSGENTPEGYRFVVNYAELEFGLERPLGAMTIGYATAMKERLL